MIGGGWGEWQPVVLRGALAVLFGAILLVWPAGTIAALVLLFGLFVLIDGIVGIIAATRARGSGRPWRGALTVGSLGVVVGLIVLTWPGATVILVIYVAAFWAIAKGLFELGIAAQLRREWGAGWVPTLSGVASLVLGVLLFFWPIAGVVAVAWIIGIYAMIFGGIMIALGLRLKRMAEGGA